MTGVQTCALPICLTQYVAGNYDAAKGNFAKATRLAPEAAEPQMNLGLISLMNKDYRQANQKFGAAAGLEELNDAMGTYYLMTGDANAAVKAFGNAKTNNAALAQILAKDYSKAKSTLAGVTAPNAMTYYITAILGAPFEHSRVEKRKWLSLFPVSSEHSVNFPHPSQVLLIAPWVPLNI